MNIDSKIARSVIPMCAAIALIVLASFATEFAFRAIALRFHSEGATLAANFSWMVGQWRYMFPALLVVMYVALVLPPMRPRTYLIAIACAQSLVIARAVVFSPPDPVPSWLWTQTLLVVPLIFCFGFWAPVRRRWKATTIADGRPGPILNGG